MAYYFFLYIYFRKVPSIYKKTKSFVEKNVWFTHTINRIYFVKLFFKLCISQWVLGQLPLRKIAPNPKTNPNPNPNPKTNRKREEILNNFERNWKNLHQC